MCIFIVSVFVDAQGGASASDLAPRVPQVVSESGTTSYAPAGILITGASETVTLGVRLSCDWTTETTAALPHSCLWLKTKR